MFSRDDISRNGLQVPALGRKFKLGSLYDAIHEDIIPGLDFWNEIDLKNVTTSRNPHTEFSLQTSDKLKEKFDDGSAKDLEKKKNNRPSVKATLLLHTAFKELTMEQLEECNLRYPLIKTTGRITYATHVVTKIQYGATATFTFTKPDGETEENEQQVNWQFESKVQQFAEYLKGDPNIESNCIDTSPENDKNIKLNFKGDFKLPDDVTPPTTCEGAIEFAEKIFRCASDWMEKDPLDNNQPLGVPITVSLYPLVLMENAKDAPTLRYQISPVMASEWFLFMQDYKEVGDELNDTIKDPLMEKLSPLTKKLQLFQQSLESFLAKLKIKLGEIAADIRSGRTTEDPFRQLASLIENEKFAFNSKRLDGWLDQKHLELCTVGKFQDETKLKMRDQSNVLFLPSLETLNDQMSNDHVKFGFEFTFSPLGRPELFLELLTQTLDTDIFNEISTETNNLNDKLWCENSSICKRIEKEIAIFAELVNENSNDKKFAFAMTSPDEYDDICANEFSIIVHNKQGRIQGWDAVLMACQHYPKERIVDVFQLVVGHFENEKLINVIRLLVEDKIPEEWNPFPFLALCRYYDKENLIDIVRFLIEKNFDVNCRTSGGWNALTLLCRNYHQENLTDIIQLLLEGNIDVNSKISEGWNALHMVCYYGPKTRFVDLVRLLVQHNIDKNLKTTGGKIGTARSFLLYRFKEDEVKDVLQMLDS